MKLIVCSVDGIRKTVFGGTTNDPLPKPFAAAIMYHKD
jgi:hypothetical protein